MAACVTIMISVVDLPSLTTLQPPWSPVLRGIRLEIHPVQKQKGGKLNTDYALCLKHILDLLIELLNVMVRLFNKP